MPSFVSTTCRENASSSRLIDPPVTVALILFIGLSSSYFFNLIRDRPVRRAPSNDSTVTLAVKTGYSFDKNMRQLTLGLASIIVLLFIR